MIGSLHLRRHTGTANIPSARLKSCKGNHHHQAIGIGLALAFKTASFGWVLIQQPLTNLHSYRGMGRAGVGHDAIAALQNFHLRRIQGQPMVIPLLLQ